MARGFATIPRDQLRSAAADGVITARALVALGVPESTVYHRCRDGGPWQRLAPGVVLMTTGHPTTGQLVTAALLHGGSTAVLVGGHVVAAAVLWWCATRVDLADRASITRFYMRVWLLFFCEYAIVATAYLVG